MESNEHDGGRKKTKAQPIQWSLMLDRLNAKAHRASMELTASAGKGGHRPENDLKNLRIDGKFFTMKPVSEQKHKKAL
jgi:hypothetical protein